MESLNVFGKKLELCSTNPMTGFYRNGCCDTGPKGYGTHTVCAVVTDEFLKFSKERGNDLTTENPMYNFKGLKSGDKWCLCALRWKEAFNAGCAPKVDLESTNEKALKYVELKDLIKHAFKRS